MPTDDDVVFSDLRLPVSLDSDGGPEFRELAEVRAVVSEATFGNRDQAETAEELLPYWQDPWTTRRMILARIGGKLVGFGSVVMPSEPGSTVAVPRVAVLPDYRHRGIGRALAEAVIRIAEAAGRNTLRTWAEHSPGAGGEPIPAPTGFGSVPSDDPGARFLIAAGWQLEQVMRVSRLDLTAASSAIPGLLETARRASEGYEAITWTGATPEELLPDMAMLHAAMSTDPPAGGLQIDEEIWTPERVVDVDTRNAESGYLTINTGARHLETGKLVGYTDFLVPSNPDQPVLQEDTIVLRGHRGHRVGMLVKATNIIELMKLAPSARLVYTTNAEENRPMLGVNEALGFESIGYEGGWRESDETAAARGARIR